MDSGLNVDPKPTTSGELVSCLVQEAPGYYKGHNELIFISYPGIDSTTVNDSKTLTVCIYLWNPPETAEVEVFATEVMERSATIATDHIIGENKFKRLACLVYDDGNRTKYWAEPRTVERDLTATPEDGDDLNAGKPHVEPAEPANDGYDTVPNSPDRSCETPWTVKIWRQGSQSWDVLEPEYEDDPSLHNKIPTPSTRVGIYPSSIPPNFFSRPLPSRSMDNGGSGVE